MKLFKYEGFKIVISEEALLIKVFKDIWNRDTSPTKNTALSELGYVYFHCDPRSDFMFLDDPETRSKEIIKQEGMPKNWKPDALVLSALEEYSYLTETTASLSLKDMKIAIKKVRQFLTEVDLNETDDNGKLKYQVSHITTAIKNLNEISKVVDKTEKEIAAELEETSRIKGERIKTLLDDGVGGFMDGYDGE